MTSFFESVATFLKRLFQRRRSRNRSVGSADKGAAKAQRSSNPFVDRPFVDRPSAGKPFSGPSSAPPSSLSATASAELRRLVYKATCRLGRKQRVHASKVALLLKQADPDFSYEKYGFAKLTDLLRAVPELVALEKVEPESSSAGVQQQLPPVYYVRSQANTTALIEAGLRAFESQLSEDGQAEGGQGWVHWQSLESAIAQKSADFNAWRYGFDDFKALLKARVDLVEFNLENADYIRLIKRPSHRSTSRLVKPAEKVQAVRPSVMRPGVKRSDRTVRDGHKPIEALMKSAGLSMVELNEKVSELASIALPETWYFGPEPPADFAYPILKSYLRYTFVRLQHEGKVLTSQDKQYRTFNTGLLNTLLQPIYALLSRSEAEATKWALDFCIAGEDYVGKTLVSEFSQLPVAANYFKNADKAFYYLDAGKPTVDWKHVVKDNMVRLPIAFLKRYAPAEFEPRSTTGMSTSEFYAYKRSFIDALDADPTSYRNIVSRLEDALEKTLRRTQINYTTAVPTYYPKINSVDLLLPMCLVNEHTVDLALVVRREPSGHYIGHTILTLRQAYNNARLICKLDDHWLPRAMTLSRSAI